MQNTKKIPPKRNTLIVCITLTKKALDLVNELKDKRDVSRSKLINDIILECPQNEILEIEYKTQKQLEICMAIYSLQKQDPPSNLRITDDSEIKKIEVCGMSLKFITQIISIMNEFSEVISIKLAYRKPETPSIS
jgi:predicted transport protein